VVHSKPAKSRAFLDSIDRHADEDGAAVADKKPVIVAEKSLPGMPVLAPKKPEKPAFKLFGK
jgi:hypothetical protein